MKTHPCKRTSDFFRASQLANSSAVKGGGGGGGGGVHENQTSTLSYDGLPHPKQRLV